MDGNPAVGNREVADRAAGVPVDVLRVGVGQADSQRRADGRRVGVGQADAQRRAVDLRLVDRRRRDVDRRRADFPRPLTAELRFCVWR